jgi:GT2 family glycosyltransferase
VVDELGLRLLDRGRDLTMPALWAEAVATLTDWYVPAEADSQPNLPAAVSASVVVATRDRPDDLRGCLRGLVALDSPRRVEIVVVDNHPTSGLTPPVVAEFPGVVLVDEPRRGLAYARNAGVLAARGDLVVTTDDDVTTPPDWLEKLVAPFVRDDIVAVTGAILPLELETEAQHLFEAYGGLGHGFEPREADEQWSAHAFPRAIPTWELGATANAAFRASLFADPRVGLFDEALGAGTPTGCSEDTYLFYKILKAGYAIRYEPAAYLWHRHRTEQAELRRQLYDYSKGHVALHRRR